MAARRLIIVLILLLGASVLAASIAPDRTGKLVGVDNGDTTTEETTTNESSTDSTTLTESTTTTTEEPIDPVEVPAGADGVRGEALQARIDASAKKPETVEAFVGDQLTLEVGSTPARTVAIVPLGLTEFAGDDAPARFNLLLREPGSFDVTDAANPNIVLGTVDVKVPASGGKAPAGEEGSKREKGQKGDEGSKGGTGSAGSDAT